MQIKSRNIRIVADAHGVRHHRVGSTDKFIYYADTLKMDNVLMFDAKTLQLTSNNEYARLTLLDDIAEDKFLKVDNWFIDKFNQCKDI